MKRKFLLAFLLIFCLMLPIGLTSCGKTKYTVTFDSDGGSAVASQRVEKGDNVQEPTAPTKDGYTFDGWYLGEEKWSFVGYVVAKNTTLKAKWKIVTYTITYYLDGGTNSSNNPSSYTVESETITLKDPQKDYYKFIGWYSDISYNNQVTEIEKGSSGNKTFYAKYIPEDPDNQLIYKLSSDGTYYSVAGYIDGIEEVVIKNTFNGLPVKYINNNAFSGCSTLKKITIQENIISIGWDAFKDCSSLISIIVDENNTNYKSIDGNLYTKDEKTLVQYAIGKTATTFKIPEDVTSISYSAFKYCSSLTSILIPSSVKSIGNDAFYFCYRLVELYNLSNINIEIGRADNGCVGYYAKVIHTSLDEPSNLVTSNGVIYYIEGTTKSAIGPVNINATSVTLDSDCTAINEFAFRECESLTSIEIPSSVTNIGDWAFQSCSSLKYNTYDNAKYLGNSENPYLVLVEAINRNITSCNINSNTKIIYDSAFSECSSLTSITIPSSVTSIGDGAFWYCSSLTKVYYGGTESDWSNITISDYNGALSSATRYYYSETAPAGEGNFWHYDTDGITIVEW